MQRLKPLNLFYSEHDPDRWFKYDRYLRRFIRRIIRGKQRHGGVMTIAINLMKGLDKIGCSYRFNDYAHIRNHPEEIACIIGRPHLLFEKKWQNPILFGAGVYSHPIECPELFERYPNVKRFIVPGDWMRKMCQPWYADKVKAWPVGIDTNSWIPVKLPNRQIDFIIYDKLNRDRDNLLTEILEPVLQLLDHHNLTFEIIRYGDYTHENLKGVLAYSKAAIFLSESETQGIAYQQILSTNTPILAWDRGGYWQDPAYYPDKVKYQPVTSVPYWDDRCGMKFSGADDFKENLPLFLAQLNQFKPRDYIIENLTLEICAEKYLDIFREVESELA
jgi:glycosyltransferase involved in cell wall biosynthesis